jgi:pentatricopeptide repeat protein
MTRKAYESEPVPFSIDKKLYRQGGPNDYLPYIENPNIKGNAISLEAYMNLVKQDHQAIKVPTLLDSYNSLPSKTLYMNIDTAYVKSLGIVPKEMEHLIPEQMVFRLKGNGLEKNTFMILDMILTGKWTRPIYFNNTSLQNAGIDFRRYVVQEGNTYRLLPIDRGNLQDELVNTEVMYDNMMNHFQFRELDNPSVYYSEDYRNFALNHRSSFNTLAAALLSEGDVEKAREVLNRSLEVIPDKSIRYDYSNVQTASLLFQVGEMDKAVDISNKLSKSSTDYLEYYVNSDNIPQTEVQKHMTILSLLSRMLKQNGQDELALEIETTFLDYYGIFNPQ